MSIFMECFYHPAYRVLCGTEAGLWGNALELGSFYNCIDEFLGTIVQQPSLILGDTPYQTATFDGEKWKRKEAVDAVRKAAQDLPDIDRCVIKMFEGARDACGLFMSEFANGSALDRATDQERELAFCPLQMTVAKGIWAPSVYLHGSVRQRTRCSIIQIGSTTRTKWRHGKINVSRTCLAFTQQSRRRRGGELNHAS